MNTYRYNEISIGQSESFTATITQELMEQFAHMTGDTNPLHTDEDFAKMEGHSGRVAYGMLTASFLSTLAGMYLPGKYSLIHEINTKFVKPVYIGDRLRISGTVTEKNDSFRLMVVKVVVENQDGNKVLRAIIKVGVGA